MDTKVDYQELSLRILVTTVGWLLFKCQIFNKRYFLKINVLACKQLLAKGNAILKNVIKNNLELLINIP